MRFSTFKRKWEHSKNINGERVIQLINAENKIYADRYSYIPESPLENSFVLLYRNDIKIARIEMCLIKSVN